jgi:diaminopimelate epimerase
MGTVRLSKHHALGNDFLVLLDLAGRVPVSAALARSLCHRRRGVGADGLLGVRRGTAGADVTMALRNADGGEAEMSGNGIRCVAQALARQRGDDHLDAVVATAVGHRRVQVRPGGNRRTAMVRVDMGPAKVDPDPGWAEVDRCLHRAAVDLGNPHLVLHVEDLSDVDPVVDGPTLGALVAGGVNVEWCAPRSGGGLDMVVWERGVGVTEACGTGACAAAAAAHGWGLVGQRTPVHMPGGVVDVELGDSVTMDGPTVHVADIDVPWP